MTARDRWSDWRAEHRREGRTDASGPDMWADDQPTSASVDQAHPPRRTDGQRHERTP